jgi:hypothetical protein
MNRFNLGDKYNRDDHQFASQKKLRSRKRTLAFSHDYIFIQFLSHSPLFVYANVEIAVVGVEKESKIRY